MNTPLIVKKGRGTNLVYKGYTHRKDGTSGGKQYWRCTQRTTCKGRVHTTGEGDNVTVVMYKDHDTHMPDEEKAVKVTVKSKLCEMAKEDPIRPLKQLYKDFITSENLPDDADDVLIPSFTGCRTQMHRSRHENFPVLPTSREEVKLEGEWATTSTGQRFLLHQDADMVILATDENLQLLADSEILFLDGTFKAAPRLYRQLFSIHGLHHGHCLPLVYCLLADKKRESYHALLDHIKRHMAELNLVLNPSKLICDFESGLLPALRCHFPNSRLKGCFFHHTKAIWTKVQDLGLVCQYNSDSNVRKQVRTLMSLAFLPILILRTNFTVVQTSEVTENTPALQQLCTYYQETWLSGSFPPALWNVSQETVRTNNSVEGWHNKLNRSIGKIHPNVFELLTHLKKEQRETEITARQASLGAAPPVRRRRYRELDEKIQRLQKELKEGHLTARDFLRRIRHVVHQF